ncbi:Centrosomin [Eumeta japonica]|uniref:Centrosomin n=1 Tax=Eumeta variegata TaxID=151549 RepID=A0A4C1TBJ1_EUMVA|nr:Centrosomin [Eumeta japonica]
MTLPVPDGHDITIASGISMKQYEEQLNGLRKENFNLKLRVYFLEEKLGHGAPPAVQGLLEHNVRLQVELEELRRQLTDKQELLAAAAEAIDVLGQQVIKTEQSGEDTCGQESEPAAEMLDSTTNNEEQEKETEPLQVKESEIGRYEEILKCKDEHIKELENKIREMQNNIEAHNNDSAGCVLGEEKKKLAESLLEQSLALPVGLKLDESMAIDEFTMDESTLDISQSLKIADLTLMFGHHLSCGDGIRNKKQSKDSIHLSRVDACSESECWSEPDRNVSMARIGLCEMASAAKELSSEANKFRMRRSRVSYGARSEEPKSASESILIEEVTQLKKRIEFLEGVENSLNDKIEISEQQFRNLVLERDELSKLLNMERESVTEVNKTAEALRQTVRVSEERCRELEEQLRSAIQTSDKLRAERQELETTFAENERSLRRAADEAAVQASQAALERARAQHDRLRLERDLEEARDQFRVAQEAKSKLEFEIQQNLANYRQVVLPQEHAHSDEERPTSPDQGIDSDRLSSLDQADGVALSPRSLYEENAVLKQKLARTKATLADTLAQLNAANTRKRNVQLAICREIHKTHGVLRKARDQLENQN